MQTASISALANTPVYYNGFWSTLIKDFLGLFLTIFSGVSVFVLGQFFLNFILKPIQDLYIVIGEISHKVKFHSNIITNSGIKQQYINWASGDMRDLSCQLESRYLVIPFKRLFSSLRIIPSRENIGKAAKYLILLSNAGGSKGNEIRNSETIDKLKSSLNISF